MAGLVPQSVFDTYNSVVDSLISTDLGINCLLIYPAQRTSCANCIYDTLSNKSSNQYNGSGPEPFTFGVCPWCGGVGYTEVQQTENIKLRIYYSRKYWIKINAMINIPDGTVQAIGFLSDYPKIMQAQRIQINSDQSGYGNWAYDLHGEPTTHGFKHNRYLVSYWKRAP